MPTLSGLPAMQAGQTKVDSPALTAKPVCHGIEAVPEGLLAFVGQAFVFLQDPLGVFEHGGRPPAPAFRSSRKAGSSPMKSVCAAAIRNMDNSAITARV
jgi:hypothetical protein